MKDPSDLRHMLAQRTVPGEVWKPMPDDWVRCYACGHRCKIAPGREGICKVRYNEGGTLKVPWGYVAGLQLDPVEKKPFFHAFPGAKALSFGMLGCDYHCPYCQNWITSQALRDPEAVSGVDEVTPDEVVDLAIRHHASILTSTYNEPLITSEWARAIFARGKERGLTTSYVSNGNATPEVLDYMSGYIDLYKIDLKGFSQREYSKLGGSLENVLETIREVHRRGLWTEIVTLVIPGFNDADDELSSIAEFIASVSADIPWHVTAFHQDYNMRDPEPTPVRTLRRAATLGSAAGLRYVYAGNLPGQVGDLENTVCPGCKHTLVRRRGFIVQENVIREGACPSCRTSIPGRWS